MAFLKHVNNECYKVWILSFVLVVCHCSPVDISREKSSKHSIDLQPSQSSYSHQYYDWAGNNPGGYEFAITGTGIIENRNTFAPRPEGYENPTLDNSLDYNKYTPGYPGRDIDYQKEIYYDGYQNNNFGNGGYGGYGGNGGLNSYYGYNNPYYQGANHLGYGYYNKKLGFGSIYNSGVTPNLVTGYRGYTRR